MVLFMDFKDLSFCYIFEKNLLDLSIKSYRTLSKIKQLIIYEACGIYFQPGPLNNALNLVKDDYACLVGHLFNFSGHSLFSQWPPSQYNQLQ